MNLRACRPWPWAMANDHLKSFPFCVIYSLLGGSEGGGGLLAGPNKPLSVTVILTCPNVLPTVRATERVIADWTWKTGSCLSLIFNGRGWNHGYGNTTLMYSY